MYLTSGEQHDKRTKEVILYHPHFGPTLGLVYHLRDELGKEIHVTSVDDPVSYFAAPPPWIEVAFIFSSSAIATGFLAKLGADIYGGLKSAVKAAYKKNSSSVDESSESPYQEPDLWLPVTITILVEGQPGIAIRGRAAGDVETVIEAIGASQTILQDALELSGLPGNVKYRGTMRATTHLREASANEESLDKQQALWFLYVYEAQHSQWTLEGVRQGPLGKELQSYRSYEWRRRN